MRIAYFVHGRGRGHASRALSAVPALRSAGHEVTLFASADALEPLALLPGVRLVDFCGRGLTAPFQLARRSWSDLERLDDIEAEAVISDGDPGGALAGRLARLPVISVGHGLVFRHCRLPRGVIDTLDSLLEQVNVATTDAWADHHVPVHFLPIKPRRETVTVARPDLRWNLPPGGEDKDDPFLLAYFSEGNGTELLDALSLRGERVVCFGEQARPPHKVDVRPHNRRGFGEHLVRCRAVVCSAGSNVLAEAILAGRPVLAVYRADHREQHMNALLVEAAGVGEAAPLPCPPSPCLDRFLRRLDERGYRRVNLAAALPPVSAVLVDQIGRLSSLSP